METTNEKIEEQQDFIDNINEDKRLLEEFKNLILEVSKETVNISLVNDIKEIENNLKKSLEDMPKYLNQYKITQAMINKSHKLTEQSIHKLHTDNDEVKQMLKQLECKIDTERQELNAQFSSVNGSLQYITKSIMTLTGKISSIEGKLSRFETVTAVKNSIADIVDKFGNKNG